MNWEPIETAPKDGTDVLLLVEGVVIEGSYHEARQYSLTEKDFVIKGEWRVAILPSHGCGCCGHDDNDPTHWMPRPADPLDSAVKIPNAPS